MIAVLAVTHAAYRDWCQATNRTVFDKDVVEIRTIADARAHRFDHVVRIGPWWRRYGYSIVGFNTSEEILSEIRAHLNPGATFELWNRETTDG